MTFGLKLLLTGGRKDEQVGWEVGGGGGGGGAHERLLIVRLLLTVVCLILVCSGGGQRTGVCLQAPPLWHLPVVFVFQLEKCGTFLPVCSPRQLDGLYGEQSAGTL